MKNSHSNKIINIFIITLFLTGLITGTLYYHKQTKNNKEYIKENITINKNYKTTIFNIKKRIKFSIIILLSSFFVITHVITIYKIFYEGFSFGFIIPSLLSKNLFFSIYIIITSFIIPILIYTILIKKSLKISKKIMLLLLKKNNIKIKKTIIQYIIISFLLILYEVLNYLIYINI